MLKLKTDLVNNFVSEDELKNMQPIVDVAHKMLSEKTGAGNDFLGWADVNTIVSAEELKKVKTATQKIQGDSDVLLVIGIGGSYLGAKAVIDYLNHSFYNELKGDKKFPEIYFVGNNISSTYIKDLEDIIAGRDFSINVISKSGTTTEPAIAFRHFKNMLVEKYGETANSRIYATTDANKGALKSQANANNWTSFIVPDNVGGRFSVLTAVGLLPIAVSGGNIDEILAGAKEAQAKYANSDLSTNDAYKYAAIRNTLYAKGKTIEMLVGYEPTLQYLNEWWKQLFGESEGKDGKGIFTASALFSTDLHSLGQYIQAGRRDLFETVLDIKNVRHEVEIKAEEVDGDGLNYLAGRSVSEVNSKAFIATAIAHNDGGVPNIVIEVEDMKEKSIGHLIYFFEVSCAISGYILGVNPFDQPGVEEYKRNMFALLGKAGYEELREELEAKLS